MRAIYFISSVLSSLALTCTATNTGNPAADNTHDQGGSEGIVLVQSELEREAQPKVTSAELEQFGDQSREFALDLYGQVVDNTNNVFLSPYSVRAGLAMLYAGAESETKEEMTSALHFALPEPTLHAAFNATDIALKGRRNEVGGDESPDKPGGDTSNEGDLELRGTNAAFGQMGMEFRTTFLDTLAINYGAGIYAVDFANESEPTRLAINQWVEEQTNSRIQDLLPKGSIEPEVALVLVNAIYFKGSWFEPFDIAETKDETFHSPASDETVPMMNGIFDFVPYTEGDGYQALELSYVVPAVRMLFILPGEGRFEEIQSALSREFVDRVCNEMSSCSVYAKVPKFTFESSFQLSEPMRALGMESVFHSRIADLSGIAGEPGYLYVSYIFHDTFVAVDEQGTEASAATAVVVKPDDGPPPTTFFLNRPFIFMIYDEPTGQILFIGHVLNPTE